MDSLINIFILDILFDLNVRLQCNYLKILNRCGARSGHPEPTISSQGHCPS